MKKLMIAMSAAAMVSLSASAADPVTLGGGIDFESLSAGDPITTEENTFWQGASGDSVVAVSNDNKYLSINTTDTLYRMTGVYAAETPTAQTIPANGDITVSNRVMFTAADDAPEVSDGDKLLIWAKAPEDDADDQNIYLMVTEKGATNKTDTVIKADTWYNLAIKAVATGSKDEGNASAKFTVYIAEASGELAQVTVDGAAKDFVSCVAENNTAAQTISSIGFNGTGAVDDIAFTKTEGEAAQYFTLTITASGTGYDTASGSGFGDDMVATTNLLVGTESIEAYVGTLENSTVTCNIEGATIGDRDDDGFVVITIPTATIAADATVEVEITVTAGTPTAVDPTAEMSYTTATEATSAASAINNSKSTMIAKAFTDMTADQKTAYDGYVVAIADGTKVVFDFTEAGTNAVQTTVNTAAAATIADVSATKVSLDAEDVVAGFFYQIVGGTVLGTFDKAGAAVQAQGKGLTLTKPELGTTTKGFYKVGVTVKNPTSAE